MKRFITWLLLAALSFSACGATIVANGPFKPAASGIAPTVLQSDTTKWDGSDTSNGVLGTSISAWSASINDVLVVVLTWRNTNNTDSLSGLAVAQFDGTAVFAGGFTVDRVDVFHDGANSTMCAIASGVVTTAGTVQMQASGFSFSAGATRRDNALMLLSGVNATAGRVNAVNSASHTTTSAATGTVATGGAGIIVAVMATQTGQASITESGGTLVVEDGNASLLYKAVTSNTTDQGAWTLATGSNGEGCAVAYKSNTP